MPRLVLRRFNFLGGDVAYAWNVVATESGLWPLSASAFVEMEQGTNIASVLPQLDSILFSTYERDASFQFANVKVWSQALKGAPSVLWQSAGPFPLPAFLLGYPGDGRYYIEVAGTEYFGAGTQAPVPVSKPQGVGRMLCGFVVRNAGFATFQNVPLMRSVFGAPQDFSGVGSETITLGPPTGALMTDGNSVHALSHAGLHWLSFGEGGLSAALLISPLAPISATFLLKPPGDIPFVVARYGSAYLEAGGHILLGVERDVTPVQEPVTPFVQAILDRVAMDHQVPRVFLVAQSGRWAVIVTRTDPLRYGGAWFGVELGRIFANYPGEANVFVLVGTTQGPTAFGGFTFSLPMEPPIYQDILWVPVGRHVMGVHVADSRLSSLVSPSEIAEGYFSLGPMPALVGSRINSVMLMGRALENTAATLEFRPLGADALESLFFGKMAVSGAEPASAFRATASTSSLVYLPVGRHYGGEHLVFKISGSKTWNIREVIVDFTPVEPAFPVYQQAGLEVFDV